MKIYLERKIRIPAVPNFILTDGEEDRQTIPLKALTRKELEDIAKEWTKELLKKAGYLYDPR